MFGGSALPFQSWTGFFPLLSMVALDATTQTLPTKVWVVGS